MTAFKTVFSNRKHSLLGLVVLSFFLFMIWGCNSSSVNAQNEVISGEDSTTNQANPNKATNVGAPKFFILTLDGNKLDTILNQRDSRGGVRNGEKVVFQFGYKKDSLTLVAYTGRKGHKFPDKRMTILDIIPEPVAINGLKDTIIFGDMEVSKKESGRGDFDELRDFISVKPEEVMVYFTPRIGSDRTDLPTSHNTNNIQNHIIYIITAIRDCGKGEKFNKDCYEKATFKAILNPVPPRNAY